MKTVTIQALLFLNHEWQLTDVEALPTACPHLFVRKMYKGGYNLTHVPTGGLFIEHIPTIKAAKEWAVKFENAADLTQPADELKKNPALWDVAREYRRQLYQR
jgi:hypothetical protein